MAIHLPHPHSPQGRFLVEEGHNLRSLVQRVTMASPWLMLPIQLLRNLFVQVEMPRRDDDPYSSQQSQMDHLLLHAYRASLGLQRFAARLQEHVPEHCLLLPRMIS